MFGFDEKKKKIFTICSIVYALLILSVVIITNFEAVASFYGRINSMLSVLSPIVIGGVIAYFCTTIIRFFQNRIFKNVKNNRARRTLSILSAYAFILLLVSSFMVLIVPQLVKSVEDLISNLSRASYWDPVFNTLDSFLHTLSDIFGEDVIEEIFGEGIFDTIIGENPLEGIVNGELGEGIAAETATGNGSSSQVILRKLINDLFKNTRTVITQLTSWATVYVGKILNGTKNVFLGVLLSIYFVLSKERLYAQSNRILAAVFTKKKAAAIVEWFRFADKTMGGFIVGKITDATLIIVVCSIVFSIAKIPYSVLISVVIGVCNIIPFFGPFIGAIPAGFIVFIAEPQKLILYIILIVVIQQIDGNIIEPKIVGDRTGLSSLGVLVAVTVMSGYFGILGMFLGVPIFAILCALAKSGIKGRLAKKNMATDLESYYSPNALVEPNEERETLSAKFFRVCGTGIVKCEKFLVKKIKSIVIKNNNESPEDAEKPQENSDKTDNNQSEQ